MNKSRRMGWAWHVASTGAKRKRERDHWVDTVGRIILKQILEKYNEGYGLDSSGLGQGPIVGSCEHNTELLGSKKC
jgi:hypothetical protein